MQYRSEAFQVCVAKQMYSFRFSVTLIHCVPHNSAHLFNDNCMSTCQSSTLGYLRVHSFHGGRLSDNVDVNTGTHICHVSKSRGQLSIMVGLKSKAKIAAMLAKAGVMYQVMILRGQMNDIIMPETVFVSFSFMSF
ncbi:hypothetical protein CAPTEDRAFT_210901 [Capitella teleta]|uniref:Uncharacterized protein n=1 Tax=Capitella teleta TaxID=283909 RepID=R7VFI9_CAPTE|nr:hypothetical protein CAPTEDRAFT_210901 [Capitella teleta]|eukprot:ELU14445.1 hypothetical protein CAPTEDRAFT_210901 [Capitella teleta]